MLRRAWSLLAIAACAGCTPALDWREVRPVQSDATVLFPCRPATDSRRVRLDGQSPEMFIAVCSASGSTFALSYADVGDPAGVEAALRALRGAAVANVAGSAQLGDELRVPGATPGPGAARVHISGRLPDGKPVAIEAAFFARGTRVFQASVISPNRIDAEAVDTFLGGLRVGS
ncbi:MAG: hypothetical protein ACM3N6_00655 [Betaproteobacteria bacterium]